MSVIDEVKDRLDLVEVVSSYLQLSKAGRNYKALCPFHSEKTPSFVIFPESQRWYCFGACNEGGDAFNFVMRMEGWDFRTALEELATQAGVELRPQTPAQEAAADEADHLRELLAAAARYYHHILLNASEAEIARSYVESRGLTDETVSRFVLGYSPSGWDRSREYLVKQGYSVDELLEAGLVIERDSGGTYDRFRERLMIPIRDRRGRVVGFGARTLAADGVPKYLNSPRTPVFDKSKTLYGLDMARRAIRRRDRAIIVEGYMDVMQAHQAGYQNVIAQMGTALTETQLRHLCRYSRRIVLSLDPDTAGVQATLHGVEVAREALEKEWEPVFDPRGLLGYEGRLGAEIRVLQLPGGKDPDDVIRADAEQWGRLVDQAVPVVDFYLQLLLDEIDLDDTKAKSRAVDQLLPLLRTVANPVEREDYVQKVARSLRVDERAVTARLRSKERSQLKGRRPPRQYDPVASADEESVEQPTDALLEGHCLSMLLIRPDLLSRVDALLKERGLEPIGPHDFGQVSLRAIFEVWENVLASRPSPSFDDLQAELPGDMRERLEELHRAADVELAEDQLARDVVVTLLRLRQRRLRQVVHDLRMLMLEAHEGGDARAKQYDQAHLAHTQVLLKTQRALSRSWEIL